MAKKATSDTRKPAAKTGAKKKVAAKPKSKPAAVKTGAAQSMGVLDGSMKNVFRSAFLNRP